jgi:hypothetical protein
LSDWPTTVLDPLVTIHSLSLESLASGANSIGFVPSVFASGTWPQANTAIFIPFALTKAITIVKMFSMNGATASGSIDLGIYDVAGTRLISSGSTAQAGTNTLQEFDITDTQIGPGLFYMAVAKNDTAGTLYRVAPVAQLPAGIGVLQQASAFALPATATFAAMAQAYFPWIGMTTRSVV